MKKTQHSSYEGLDTNFETIYKKIEEDRRKLIEHNKKIGFEQYWTLNYIDRTTNSNKKITREKFGYLIKYIENLIDAELKIASSYFWLLDIYFVKTTEPIVIGAVIKNLYALYAALKLNNMGLFGSSIVLIRQCFEALLISKYYSLYPKSLVLNKWNQKQRINLTNDVLKNIKNPDVEPFKILWSHLNKITHPTRSSQQPLVIFADNKKEINLAYHFMILLLGCNYHLLNSHMITPSMRYYLRLYRDNKKANIANRKIKMGLSVLPKVLSKESKKVLNVYKRKWKIQENHFQKNK